MLSTGNADLDKAAATVIEGHERQVRAELLVDWNGNGKYDHPLSDLSAYVSTVSVDRSLKGAAPAELLLVEGSAAAELTCTVGGTYKAMPFSAVFSPYNGLSPLFRAVTVGAEVKYRIGVATPLGVAWYPSFVGNIRLITPDRATGHVEISALDRAEKLRKPVHLAPYAMSSFWQNRQYTTNQLFNTVSVVQSCLQQCEVSCSGHRAPTLAERVRPEPQEPATLVNFFLSGMGGTVPTAGWYDNIQSVEPLNDQYARFNRQAMPNPSAPDQTRRYLALSTLGNIPTGNMLKYWPSDRHLVSIEGNHYVAMTFNVTGSVWHKTAPRSILMEVRVGEMRVLRVMIENNQVYPLFRNEKDGKNLDFPGQRFTLPDTGSVDFFMQWDTGTGGTRYNARLGDKHTDGWVRVANGFPPGDEQFDVLTGLISIWPRLSMSDMCYAFRAIGSAGAGGPEQESNVWKPATYAAELDDGVNSLSYMPNVNGQDAWDVVTGVASSEFGSVFWDEAGVFRFWNLARIQAARDSPRVRALTIDQVAGLKITNNFDSVRNVITTQVGRSRSRSFLTVAEARGADDFYVPGGQTRVFEIRKDGIMFTEPRFLQRYTQFVIGPCADLPYWNEVSRHGYVCQWRTGPDEWREFNTKNWGEHGEGRLFAPQVRTWIDARGVVMLSVGNDFKEDTRFATWSGTGKDQDPLHRSNSANGTAALRIDGTLIEADDIVPASTREQISIDHYGERNWELSGEWYQDFFPTNDISQRLLSWTRQAVPSTDAVTVPGDPRMQMGDCLDLADPGGFGERIGLQVSGYTRVFDRDNGLTDTLTVEMLRPPDGSGRWDSDQFGRWDTTFEWGT